MRVMFTFTVLRNQNPQMRELHRNDDDYDMRMFRKRISNSQIMEVYRRLSYVKT